MTNMQDLSSDVIRP